MPPRDKRVISIGAHPGTGLTVAETSAQKLGFYGKAPIAQQGLSTTSSAATIVTFLYNLGLSA